MKTRQASCSCGQLRLTCEGDPDRVSVCHCLACQQRTGSVFGAQARFDRKQIAAIEGSSAEFIRAGDTGKSVRFHFCPACGSTVHWELGGNPGFVMVAVGAFADPDFPAPSFSVYEARRHPWAFVPDGDEVEHWD